LLRYEEKRLLNPIRDAKGHRRYDPEELRKLGARLAREGRGVRKTVRRARAETPRPLPARDVPPEPRVSGVITKRAFEMFERGESRSCVAIEFGEPVENVNWLHENWLAMSGRKGAAQTSARDSIPWSSPPRPRAEPVVKITTEAQVRAIPPEQRTEADRDWIRWIDQLDEEKRRHDEAHKGDGMEGPEKVATAAPKAARDSTPPSSLPPRTESGIPVTTEEEIRARSPEQRSEADRARLR